MSESGNGTRGMVRTICYAIAAAISVGSIMFAIGNGSAKSGAMDREFRLRKVEETVVRWDERWSVIQASLSKIEMQLKDLTARPQ